MHDSACAQRSIHIKGKGEDEDEDEIRREENALNVHVKAMSTILAETLVENHRFGGAISPSPHMKGGILLPRAVL
jgi:hypothetical protein